MKNEIQTILQARTEGVNRAIDRLLPPPEGEYAVVKEAMRYSMEAGGKRVRPLLVLEFARLAGLAAGASLPEEKAMPFACAVECIHTYSLIHDDLPCMDDDALRRGRPSCHIAFGEANALLAGDALLTYAFELIGRGGELSGLSAEASTRACRILARFAGVDGMVGGQVMDLQNEGRSIGADVLRNTVLGKTSALLSAACALGVAAADGSREWEAAAVRYGELLGLAFQTVDDILDVTGSEAALGKPIGSDSQNEKVTAVTLLGLEGAQESAARLTAEALEALDGLFGLPPLETELLREWTRFLLTRDR